MACTKQKTGLAFSRHTEIGIELQRIRDYLTHLSVEISNTYPKAARVVGKACRAADAVDSLRCALDSRVFDEYPSLDDRVLMHVYYLANQKGSPWTP